MKCSPVSKKPLMRLPIISWIEMKLRTQQEFQILNFCNSGFSILLQKVSGYFFPCVKELIHRVLKIHSWNKAAWPFQVLPKTYCKISFCGRPFPSHLIDFQFKYLRKMPMKRKIILRLILRNENSSPSDTVRRGLLHPGSAVSYTHLTLPTSYPV